MSSENHTTGAPKPDERPRFDPRRWPPQEKEAIAHFIRAMSSITCSRMIGSGDGGQLAGVITPNKVVQPTGTDFRLPW